MSCSFASVVDIIIIISIPTIHFPRGVNFTVSRSSFSTVSLCSNRKEIIFLYVVVKHSAWKDDTALEAVEEAIHKIKKVSCREEVKPFYGIKHISSREIALYSKLAKSSRFGFAPINAAK